MILERSEKGSMAVNFVGLRASHHSGHSGYDLIAQYLGRSVPSPATPRWPPGRLPQMLNTGCALVSKSPWYTFSAFRQEVATLREMVLRDRQIYHFLYGDMDCRFVPLLNGSRHLIIATYHQPPTELAVGVPNSTLRRLSAAVVVASSQVEYFGERIGTGRVFVIPHGVDTEYFVPADRAILDPPLILSVGSHLRDFGTYSHAIPIISQCVPEARFIMITQRRNEHYFSGLSNVAILSNISDDELLLLYQQATIVVLPLQNCTANNALLEAMACGVPVVVTDVGGVRDYVDESCARLVPVANADALAQTVVGLLSNESERRRLGTAACLQAKSFSFWVVAKQMQEMYAKLWRCLD